MEDLVLPALPMWGPTAAMMNAEEQCLYSSPDVIIYFTQCISKQDEPACIGIKSFM